MSHKMMLCILVCSQLPLYFVSKVSKVKNVTPSFAVLTFYWANTMYADQQDEQSELMAEYANSIDFRLNTPHRARAEVWTTNQDHRVISHSVSFWTLANKNPEHSQLFPLISPISYLRYQIINSSKWPTSVLFALRFLVANSNSGNSCS